MFPAATTVWPMLWLVSRELVSSWVRSVTKTTFQSSKGGVPPQLPDHEDHGQRLAGALGVPDDTAALGRRVAVGHPLQHLMDGAELLVAGDHLIRASTAVRREQGEGLQQGQQVLVGAHPGGEARLVAGRARRTCLPWLAGLGGHLIQTERPGVAPAVEMPRRVRR